MHGAVVMIHGMWCGSWTWDRYAPFLEQRGWRCLRPVLRYHDVDPAAQPDPCLGRAAALLTPSAPAGVNALTGSVIRSFLGVLLRPSFWKTPMRLSFPAAGYAMLGTLPPEEQRATYARLVHESGRAATEMGFWQLDRRHAARIDPSCIRCPVLIVSASDDRLTPASVVGKTASLLGPRAELREFPGHGHWVVGEPGWQEIAAFVADWLDTRTRGRP